MRINKSDIMNHNSNLFKSTILHWITGLFVLVVVLSITVSLPGMLFDQISSTYQKRNALRYAEKGIQRLLTTRYVNILPCDFITEQIDIDLNGTSTFETLEYSILSDQPYNGLKTVKVNVFWPNDRDLSESKTPVLNTIGLTVILHNPEISRGISSG